MFEIRPFLALTMSCTHFLDILGEARIDFPSPGDEHGNPTAQSLQRREATKREIDKLVLFLMIIKV
jgi:hypothetical protein